MYFFRKPGTYDIEIEGIAHPCFEPDVHCDVRLVSFDGDRFDGVCRYRVVEKRLQDDPGVFVFGFDFTSH